MHEGYGNPKVFGSRICVKHAEYHTIAVIFGLRGVLLQLCSGWVIFLASEEEKMGLEVLREALRPRRLSLASPSNEASARGATAATTFTTCLCFLLVGRLGRRRHLEEAEGEAHSERRQRRSRASIF